MHVGATLRMLRTTSGMSLRALASHIGVSVAYLSRVEHGHDPPPTPDRLSAIAAVLGLPEDLLTDLVESLRPDALAWLGRSTAGRKLAVELHRRRLTPAQLARILDFVEQEFPAARTRQPPMLTKLLTEEQIVLGVTTHRLQDVLEIGALRLGLSGPALQELSAREATNSSSIGAGLLIPHLFGHLPAPKVALLTLTQPLPLPTADGQPIQVLLLLAGLPMGVAGAVFLARAAHLAEAAVIDALLSARTPAAALAVLRQFEQD